MAFSVGSLGNIALEEGDQASGVLYRTAWQ